MVTIYIYIYIYMNILLLQHPFYQTNMSENKNLFCLIIVLFYLYFPLFFPCFNQTQQPTNQSFGVAERAGVASNRMGNIYGYL